MRIILDTNVFVSGVFWSGPPQKILEAWAVRKISLVLSLEILEEYQRIGRGLHLKYPTVDFAQILMLLEVNAEIAEVSGRPAELELIAKKYFDTLKGPPTANNLGFRKNGNSFDDYIRGWTQFWNDVLGGKELLDPNLVKALIATESGFRPNKDTKDSPKNGYARGLMQVTDSTLRILADDKGELRNHLVHIDQEDIHDPKFNIAAGVRWLFHKKDLASSKLGREASWDEAVAEYKSLLQKMRKNPSNLPKPMRDLHDYYNRLKK